MMSLLFLLYLRQNGTNNGQNLTTSFARYISSVVCNQIVHRPSVPIFFGFADVIEIDPRLRQADLQQRSWEGDSTVHLSVRCDHAIALQLGNLRFDPIGSTIKNIDQNR